MWTVRVFLCKNREGLGAEAEAREKHRKLIYVFSSMWNTKKWPFLAGTRRAEGFGLNESGLAVKSVRECEVLLAITWGSRTSKHAHIQIQSCKGVCLVLPILGRITPTGSSGTPSRSYRKVCLCKFTVKVIKNGDKIWYTYCPPVQIVNCSGWWISGAVVWINWVSWHTLSYDNFEIVGIWRKHVSQVFPGPLI